jgi:hypothetical protein
VQYCTVHCTVYCILQIYIFYGSNVFFVFLTNPATFVIPIVLPVKKMLTFYLCFANSLPNSVSDLGLFSFDLDLGLKRLKNLSFFGLSKRSKNRKINVYLDD